MKHRSETCLDNRLGADKGEVFKWERIRRQNHRLDALG
jgi:hypothetical protein